MENVKSIINKHNNTVLHPPTNNSERTYNCINSETCPLQQKCLTNNIMYKATITSNQDNYHHKIYYGITETKIQIAICKQHKILNFQMNYGVLKTTTTP